MALNEAGYLRPQFKDEPTAAENRLISSFCSGSWPGFEGSEAPHDTIWGPVLELFTGYVADAEMRFRASSGGALSAVLHHLLASGQADYILHIGADDERH